MPLTEDQKRERAEKRRLTAALKEEEQAHRREAQRREWQVKDMYLTRDQAAAGEPCRGCGLPVIDNLGPWAPLMHLTDQERVDHDFADAIFKGLHPDCRSHRWSMQGSRTTHCGLCCPPLPLSASQFERIARILNGHVRREEELDIWALDLTCGHRTEHSGQHTQRNWVGSTVLCGECGVIRGVVASERIIEAADRAAEVKRKRETEVAKAEKEVAKAESAAAAAREKLAALRVGQ